jgi:hypothetical protein
MNSSNNFNYVGNLASGGGSSTVTIDPDISYHEETYIHSTGFTVVNNGLGAFYSHARNGGGLLHVAVKTNQPSSLPIIPVPLQITIWSSNVHAPTLLNQNFFPTHQKLEFDPQEVYTRSIYNTAPQANMLSTSLRITHKYYFFTIDNPGDNFIDPDFNIIICHSIHRSV